MNFLYDIMHFKRVPLLQMKSSMDFDPADYNLSWGHMAISEACAYFIKEMITTFNVHTILEFGSGVSTLFLNNLATQVVSFETNADYLNTFKSFSTPYVTFKLWDGKELPEEDTHYDLSFVDGPMFGENRFFSTQYAALNSDIVIIHDAFRKDDYYNQAQHLLPNPHFKSVIFGGASRIVQGHLYYYCYCWTPFEINELPKKILLENPVLTPLQVASLHQ